MWYFLANAGHTLTKKGVRSGTSSEPVSRFGRKHSSYMPLWTALNSSTAGQHDTLFSMLCFKPFSLSLDFFFYFFWALQSFSVLPVSWNPWSGDEGSSFHKGEQVLYKTLLRQRCARFWSRGEWGLWREMGVFLEAREDPGKRRQNVFSNLQVSKPSELQTSVRRSRLCHLSILWTCYCSELLESWFGNRMFGESMTVYIVQKCQAFLLFPFHTLSTNVVFSMLHLHWQNLLLSDC